MDRFVVYYAESNIIWFNIGSDAGGTGIDLSTGKVVHGEGWGIEAMQELGHAVSALGQIAQMKNPELIERSVAPLGSFVMGQLSEHLG